MGPGLDKLRTLLVRHRLVLGVTIAALAVRLVWNLKVHPPSEFVFSDMAGYVARADRLLDHPTRKFADEAFFPFGAHYLLAAVKLVFGKANHTATAVYQAIIGAFTVGFMTATAGRLAAPRLAPWVAAIVGAIGVFYYPLISYGGYYMSEAPFAFFLAASVWLSLRLADEGRPGDAWWLGLAIGLAATCRPQILLSLPFVGLLWLARRKELPGIRWGGLLRVALPLALVLGLSMARAHYHTGRASIVAQNGAVNWVFGRCHNVKTGGARSWFGPPPLGMLFEHSKKEPDSIIQLDPAMGLDLSVKGPLWEEHRLYALARKCVEKSGWRRQAQYAATHAVMLWGYNVAWPDMGQDRYRKLMKGWNVGAAFVLFPPTFVAFVLGFRRRHARQGLLAIHFAALTLVGMLYFGDIRLRTPYDAIFIVLSVELCARGIVWLIDRRKGRGGRVERGSEGAASGPVQPES